MPKGEVAQGRMAHIGPGTPAARRAVVKAIAGLATTALWSSAWPPQLAPRERTAANAVSWHSGGALRHILKR